MSVLTKYFDSSVNQASPVQTDYERRVNYADGAEVVTFVVVDYPSIQASHGVVEDWSLNSLLSAGINPNFPIHTGLPTRIEGANTVLAASEVAEQILSDSENKDSDNN